MAATAIAPITGKIRKFFILNVAGSLGIGTALGYWFWYGVHLPKVKKQDDWYAKYHAEKVA